MNLNQPHKLLLIIGLAFILLSRLYVEFTITGDALHPSDQNKMYIGTLLLFTPRILIIGFIYWWLHEKKRHLDPMLNGFHLLFIIFEIILRTVFMESIRRREFNTDGFFFYNTANFIFIVGLIVFAYNIYRSYKFKSV